MQSYCAWIKLNCPSVLSFDLLEALLQLRCGIYDLFTTHADEDGYTVIIQFKTDLIFLVWYRTKLEPEQDIN